MMTGIAGQVVLWAGFLSAALASVSRLEVEDNPWRTIPWIWYGVSILVGVGGIFLLRMERAIRKTTSAESETGIEAVQAALRESAASINQLDQRLEDMTCEDVLAYIDEKCAPTMNDFADHRVIIRDRFGTRVFASVMTEFASGERYLNRAWSAAADGYVDEVALTVRYARDFMLAAVNDLDKAVRE